LNEDGLSISRLFPAGTILMTIAANIGDCAILTFDSACPDSVVGIQIKPKRTTVYFLTAYLNSIKEYYRYRAPRSAQHNTNVETLSQYQVPLPPLPEQQKIAEILSTWDNAIEQAAALIAAKRQQKKALMQQLLTGQRRLPGFAGEWKSHEIGNIFKVVSRPVDWDDDAMYKLLSVRRRSGGVFLREELKGSRILTKNMFTACKGDFLISKMQVVHGATGLVPDDLDGCHISGSYIVLQPRSNSIIDRGFFSRLSSTAEFYHLTFVSSYGVHIEKMTFDLNWFMKSRVELPSSLEEQRAIAAVLDTADREIKSLEEKLEALRQQKKGLMQRLLTGQVRVKT
jgi:type I restriction enzyme S subunit